MSKPTILKRTYVFKNSTPAPEKLRKQTDDSLKNKRKRQTRSEEEEHTQRCIDTPLAPHQRQCLRDTNVKRRHSTPQHHPRIRSHPRHSKDPGLRQPRGAVCINRRWFEICFAVRLDPVWSWFCITIHNIKAWVGNSEFKVSTLKPSETIVYF